MGDTLFGLTDFEEKHLWQTDMQEDFKNFSNITIPAPWLSWLKRLSSKQEIASSNLAGALDLLFFVNRYKRSEFSF